MRKLPHRQVHLDFHTGPDIPDVGKKFDKHEFQAALKEGNLDSITVFAKCHHGCMYYPSKYGVQHPTMEQGFDLTGAMIDAAHEIGVAAPVYITVGWSQMDAEKHPEWGMKNKDGAYFGLPTGGDDADRPYYLWQHLCPGGEYAELIYHTAEEVCRRYTELDGLFFDIVYLEEACYCDNCVAEMRAEGLDPYDLSENKKHYIRVHKRFARRLGEILHTYHPEATIFFNSGGAEIYRPEYHEDQSHFEMEDLPTAWGGYDRFVPRASYMSRYGKDYLGMTGKFHAAWGEFGGFKNATALKYELAMMGMHGAGCSVGDQLPPSGRPDMETYRLIGEGYRFYERYEPWFFEAENMADVGVYLSGKDSSDLGLFKMLLERQVDLGVVHPSDELSRYRAVILPDAVTLDETQLAALRAYQGLILCTGHSLLQDGRFLLDCGAEYAGESPYDVDYLRSEQIPIWVKAPFLCVTPAVRMTAIDGEVLASVYEPYFRRTNAHFCSHRNTPYCEEKSPYAGIVKKGNVIRFAHPLCEMYEKEGVQLYRDILVNTLLRYCTPSCTAELPSAGRIHLTHQAEQKRYVFHISYAQPIQRGSYSVIEDAPTLSNIACRVSVPKKIIAVREANGDALPFRQEKETVCFTLPHLSIYTAISLEYEM